MNSTFVTNVLLIVVAGLLLVQIVQNSLGESSENSSISYHRPAGHPATSTTSRNPTVTDSATNMAHSMFYQALKAFPSGCEGLRTLTECDSPAAQSVKAEIEQQVAQGSGPRQVFDYVVNKYGIEALTEEAQRIRGARTGQ